MVKPRESCRSAVLSMKTKPFDRQKILRTVMHALGHDPNKYALEPDPEGWVNVVDLVQGRVPWWGLRVACPGPVSRAPRPVVGGGPWHRGELAVSPPGRPNRLGARALRRRASPPTPT